MQSEEFDIRKLSGDEFEAYIHSMEDEDDTPMGRWGHLKGDKFVVEYKDGSDRVFKHVHGGIEQLLAMVDLDKVEEIGDI